ncbi:hypothetical protein P7K49_011085 [Saguinus oedipus]|uniref:Uncharacterized protein n=1 Tax=Saguinus oedipus TaxID=9490 RepID=A0ABQ9VR16_SAGOE|nr:hypothetical protein P7K49_011085 [Saguinus oedipus]
MALQARAGAGRLERERKVDWDPGKRGTEAQPQKHAELGPEPRIGRRGTLGLRTRGAEGSRLRMGPSTLLPGPPGSASSGTFQAGCRPRPALFCASAGLDPRIPSAGKEPRDSGLPGPSVGGCGWDPRRARRTALEVRGQLDGEGSVGIQRSTRGEGTLGSDPPSSPPSPGSSGRGLQSRGQDVPGGAAAEVLPP